VQSFKNLEVWDRAHTLTLDIYRSSKSYPSGRNLRTDRVKCDGHRRRSGATLPKVLVGEEMRGDADLAPFLPIALGSASELEYQSPLARDLERLLIPDYERLMGPAEEIKKMLAALLKNLRVES